MARLSLAFLVLSVGAASAAVGDWFPDWDGGSGKCLEEVDPPAAPTIFVEHDGYYESTMTACCERYFDGEAEEHCLDATSPAQNHTGTGEWYAKWNDDPSRCAKDCPTDYGDPSCGGLLGQFGTPTTYGSAESCCDAQFASLVTDYCVTISQEHEYKGTKDWYLDSSDNICVQDCEGSAPCGGIVTQASWPTLYASNEVCCETALSSLDTEFCKGLSNSTYEGTNKWFVDSQNSVCVKDCVGSGDECARATRYDDLHDTAAACCSAKLGWLDDDYCESRSDPTTHGVNGPYTDKWFVDYANHICSKDCDEAGNDACAKLDANPTGGLFDTPEACCSAKLSYLDTDECEDYSLAGAEGDPTGTGNWYASYSAKKCVKDCPDGGDDLCGGVVSRSNGVEKYDTVSACCSARFGWYNQDLCVAMSDGTETTGMWYVDYQENVCVNDCPEGGGDSCAGPPDDWGTPMYDTAAACCSAKLNWLDQDACELKSENGADAPASGTDKWYAHYSNGRCAKDCAETNSDPACQGIVESNAGHIMFDSAESCCRDRFGWVNSDFCKVKSESDGTAYSDLYYADQQDKVCYKDCSGGDGCKGAPEDLATPMFDSAETCCSEKLNWVNKDKCMQVPESQQGSGKWWINWQLNKCVKDCPTSQGSECGGLAESWDNTYSSSGACCSQPAFAWTEKKNCVKS